MQIIGIIFNVFFLFILLLMMGFGFLFGMWRKLRSLGGLLIGILLLLIFMNPIAKGIVNADLPFIGQSITELVMEKLSSGMEIASDGELALLCNSVALSLAKIIVLFLGMLVVFAVIVPLNLIIVRIVVGRDEHKKNIGIRFAGMGIAVAEVLIGFFLITLPIFGTTSLIMSYEDVLSTNEDTKEIIEAVEVIDNVIPNKITKIFGKKAPVNALGSITKVKNKNGKINIFKEVYNAKPVLVVLLDAESKYEGDFLSSAINHKEELINFIRETNILETFMPAVLEFLEAKGSLEGIDIEELKKIDFANDKTYLADMLDVLFDFIEETNLDFENPEAILGNENLPLALKDLGDALKDTSFLDLLLGLLQNTLDDALSSSGDLGVLTEILDVTKIEKENLSNDLYQLGIVANSIYNVGILEENPDLLSKPEELKKLINAVLDFSLVKGNESKIIDTLLGMANLKDSLGELGIEINYTNVNWEEEKVNLGNIIDSINDADKNIPNFSFENIGEYLKNDNDRQYVIKMFSSLMESSLIGDDFIANIIDEIIKESELGIDTSKLDLSKVVSWENEINAIFKLIDLYKEDNINLSSISEEELNELIEVAIGTLDEPNYIASFLLGSVVNNGLKDFLGEKEYQEFVENHNLTDPNVLRQSAKDIVSVIKITVKFEETPDIEEWTKDEIKDLCETVSSLDIKNSEVTASILYGAAKETGADISKEDIQNADLEKESLYLEEILTAINEEQSKSEIKELIEKAKQETVVISAIIDKFYEE